MAPAGIEPATRWISPSRSTGELQEPGTKPTGVEPALSRETVGRAGRYATASSATECRWYDPTNASPPGSRVTTREPAIRRQPYQRQHCCITCIHRLSKSILHGANAERPTRVITQVGRWCRPREQWKGLGVPSHRSPLRSRTIRTADQLPVRRPRSDSAAGKAFQRIHVASRRCGRGAASPGVMRPAKSWQ